MKKMTRKEEKELARLIGAALEKPPTIGLVGVSGVGKSSTINAMFKTDLPVSHTVACTKEFWALEADLTLNQGPAQGQAVKLLIHDAPGLGEDLAKDDEYLAMYREKLPRCDVILWVLAARNRAVALDQQYLTQLAGFHDRIVFGLNQVDLVQPMNWKSGLPIPSVEQEKHIEEIVADRSRRLSPVIGREVEVIPYSTVRGYNLEALFTAMLAACADHRSWILSGLKNFSYKDTVPKELWRGQEKVSLNSPPPAEPAMGERSPKAERERHPGPRLSTLLGRISNSLFGSEPSPRAEDLEVMESRLKAAKKQRLSDPDGKPVKNF